MKPGFAEVACLCHTQHIIALRWQDEVLTILDEIIASQNQMKGYMKDGSRHNHTMNQASLHSSRSTVLSHAIHVTLTPPKHQTRLFSTYEVNQGEARLAAHGPTLLRRYGVGKHLFEGDVKKLTNFNQSCQHV
eukprot:342792-Amphidinium_carterae.3